MFNGMVLHMGMYVYVHIFTCIAILYFVQAIKGRHIDKCNKVWHDEHTHKLQR